jgi:hypothetical protein
MAFNPQDCFIETVYCGSKRKNYPYVENDMKYISTGTPEQCLKKGFGAGLNSEKNKNLNRNSLLNIKYIGPVFERRFHNFGIRNIDQLLNYCRVQRKNVLKNFLEQMFRDANGRVNKNGYNSVLLFLYRNGMFNNLPICRNN